MANVRVTFVNPATGDKMVDAQVDDSFTVEMVIAELVSANFIKPEPPGFNYTLEIKTNQGRIELKEKSDTLKSAGVADGDEIIVGLVPTGAA